MTYDNEIAAKILQLVYDSWFKDYYSGLSIQDIIVTSGNSENEINQAIGFLESNGWIIENDPGRYIINDYGIDIYEKGLPLEIQAAKKHERTKILQILAETYKINTNELMPSEIIREKMQLTDPTLFTDSSYLFRTKEFSLFEKV